MTVDPLGLISVKQHGGLCLTGGMCRRSCFLSHSLPQWEFMSICVNQDVLTRSCPHQARNQHLPVANSSLLCSSQVPTLVIYLMAKSFHDLGSVWDRQWCTLTPYSRINRKPRGKSNATQSYAGRPEAEVHIESKLNIKERVKIIRNMKLWSIYQLLSKAKTLPGEV